MADTEAPKIVESTVEEKKVEEKEKVVEPVVEATKEPAKVEENGEKVENGDSKEESKEKSEDKDEPAAEPTDKCCIKRKSTGDAVDGKAAEATPEKKAKLDDAPVIAEANGEITEAEATA